MSAEVFDIATLLSPLEIDHFLADYWETKPLCIHRHDRDYFRTLLSGEDLENIISGGDLRYPAVRLAKGGGYYPPEAYTANLKYGDDFFNGVPDVDRILSEYRSGATITLPALHRTWAPLKALSVALENYFDHALHSNVYITPGNAMGFTPHYDTHEVFILQIAGKKHWRVYDPPVTLPHRSQPFTPYGYTPPPAPLLETELEAGDLLYLPRGHVHAATTSDTYSAHITIGITVYTWVELAAELLKSCKEKTRYRKALPPGFASRAELKETLKQGLSDLLDELHQSGDYDPLIEHFSQRVTAGRTRPGSAFRCDAVVIGPQTVLKAPGRGDYRIVKESGSTVLEYDGKRLALPEHLRPLLEAMCARTSFRTEELPTRLDDEKKLAFVRYLNEQGFLKPLSR
jgi:ribosomal protein L16 Arg81 hydroxylase